MRATKSIAFSAVLATVVASQAFAGGYGVAVVEPPIAPVVMIEPEPAVSSYGFLIPIVALAAMAAVAISNQ